MPREPKPWPRLTPRQCDALSALLLQCHVLRDERTRSDVLSRLPDEMSIRMENRNTPHLFATAVVTKSNEFPGGLREMIEAVRHFEGPTSAMKAIDVWCKELNRHTPEHGVVQSGANNDSLLHSRRHRDRPGGWEQQLRTLPRLLARAAPNPVPFLLRVGIPREVCEGKSALDRWTYVCDWLICRGLTGAIQTLKLLDDFQEESFSHDISHWAASFIRSLTGMVSGGEPEPYPADTLATVLQFAIDERQRWERVIEELERRVVEHNSIGRLRAFATPFLDLWTRYGLVLQRQISAMLSSPQQSMQSSRSLQHPSHCPARLGEVWR